MARDALLVLRAAVGAQTCEACNCDVNGDTGVTAVDALLVLDKAVGLETVTLECGAGCSTTTLGPPPTVVGDCFSDFDCAPLAHCCAYVCAECDTSDHCLPGFACGGDCHCERIEPSTTTTLATTTTIPFECSTNSDCSDPQRAHCCGKQCSECSSNADCADGKQCDATCSCVADATTMIYWSEARGDVVRRAHADGSAVEILAFVSRPRGIALDTSARHFYVGSATRPYPEIVIGNVDGDHTASTWYPYLFVNGGDPNYLFLDGCAQKLFWSRIGWHVGFDVVGAVQSAATDATGGDNVAGAVVPEDVAVSCLGEVYWADSDETDGGLFRLGPNDDKPEVIKPGIRPVGIALDSGGHLYWTDSVARSIVRTDLTTGEDVTVVSGLGLPTDVALDERNAKLYWVDFRRGTIKRSNLDGTNIKTLATGLESPFSIALDSTLTSLTNIAAAMCRTDP